MPGKKGSAKPLDPLTRKKIEDAIIANPNFVPKELAAVHDVTNVAVVRNIKRSLIRDELIPNDLEIEQPNRDLITTELIDDPTVDPKELAERYHESARKIISLRCSLARDNLIPRAVALDPEKRETILQDILAHPQVKPNEFATKYHIENKQISSLKRKLVDQGLLAEFVPKIDSAKRQLIINEFLRTDGSASVKYLAEKFNENRDLIRGIRCRLVKKGSIEKFVYSREKTKLIRQDLLHGNNLKLRQLAAKYHVTKDRVHGIKRALRKKGLLTGDQPRKYLSEEHERRIIDLLSGDNRPSYAELADIFKVPEGAIKWIEKSATLDGILPQRPELLIIIRTYHAMLHADKASRLNTCIDRLEKWHDMSLIAFSDEFSKELGPYTMFFHAFITIDGPGHLYVSDRPFTKKIYRQAALQMFAELGHEREYRIVHDQNYYAFGVKTKQFLEKRGLLKYYSFNPAHSQDLNCIEILIKLLTHKLRRYNREDRWYFDKMSREEAMELVQTEWFRIATPAKIKVLYDQYRDVLNLVVRKGGGPIGKQGGDW